MLLDNLIQEKSNLISYTKEEVSNIATTSNHLRDIIKNQPDYRSSFLGGSYKRGTMVKGISDVDVYFEYTGVGNPQNALTRLRTSLDNSYPNTPVKQDKPSILVDFQRIPFNITPYKNSLSANTINIPDAYLSSWQAVNFGELEVGISALRNKNSKFIDLIRILKLWNKNYNRGLKNFDIEKRVCNLFLYSNTQQSIADWMYTFFANNGFPNDAQAVNMLMLVSDTSSLKSAWSKFIDKK